MSPLRVLSCDDEPLALDRLDRMLMQSEDVDVVASCADADTALGRIAELRPDIAFLDIEMPKLDGFDVVEQLPKCDAPPLIVFVTAFSRFAAQAFETGALDFLEKPVRRSRLATTLERARVALAAREASARLIELRKTIDGLRSERVLPGNHIWVQRRGETVRVDLAMVDLVRAEGEYVRLFVGPVTYLHRELIGAFERKLDPRRFIRIHRSTIVRLDLISAIRRSIHGGAVIRLATGEEFPVGRKYSKQTRGVLNLSGSDRPSLLITANGSDVGE